jgi:hypothetical protein
MKTRSLLTLFTLISSASLFGQYAVPVDARSPYAPPALPPVSPDQIDQLVSPIALYPDPLVAIILPAATTPGDITIADRLARAKSDPSVIDSQPWDESVRALAHYPQLIAWMDDNLEWTQQLGVAFLQQPADVMNSIQRLRERARAAGILVTTPQEQVVVQDNAIEILPAEPNVIYIPTYDPEILYSSATYGGPRSSLSFGIAFATGPWLDYDFNWRDRTVWIDRSQTWNRREPRGYAYQSRISTERREWRPRVDVTRRAIGAPRATTQFEVVRPAPLTQTRSWSRDRNATSRAVVEPAPRTVAPPLAPSPMPTGRTYEQPAVRTYPAQTAPAPAPSVAPNEQSQRERSGQWQRERGGAPVPQVYTTPAPVPPRDQRVVPQPQAQAQPATPGRGQEKRAVPEKGKDDRRKDEDKRKDDDDERRRGDG